MHGRLKAHVLLLNDSFFTFASENGHTPGQNGTDVGRGGVSPGGDSSDCAPGGDQSMDQPDATSTVLSRDSPLIPAAPVPQTTELQPVKLQGKARNETTVWTGLAAE